MGVLTDIDTTLKNSDISLIKKKLFTNLYNLGRSYSGEEIVAFSFYELKNLDLSIDEIELLLQHGVCISHAIFNEIYLAYDTPIKFVSDFDACKLYMHDPAEFYKQYGIEVDKISGWEHTAWTSDHIERKLLSCMLLFDAQTQQEYYTFGATYFDKHWNTGYDGSSGVGMFYKYSFPSCN